MTHAGAVVGWYCVCRGYGDGSQAEGRNTASTQEGGFHLNRKKG